MTQRTAGGHGVTRDSTQCNGGKSRRIHPIRRTRLKDGREAIKIPVTAAPIHSSNLIRSLASSQLGKLFSLCRQTDKAHDA
jgi:hypothetical protein